MLKDTGGKLESDISASMLQKPVILSEAKDLLGRRVQFPIMQSSWSFPVRQPIT
jgi:hypothetical protein